MLNRVAVLLFGVVSYAIFFGSFLYGIGFVGNFLVPVTIDGEPTMSLAPALLIDTLLIALFAVQHSVMARPTFKKWWSKFVADPIERSMYVLLSSLALIVLYIFWQPLGGEIWNVQNSAGQAVLYGLLAMGWLLILVTTFLINHFDLFGLRQVWLYFQGREYTSLNFVTPALYSIVRHPLYVGWLMAFWFTPSMTTSHLIFALLMAVYILVAIQLEERNLVEYHGEDYAEYRRNTPMLIPRFGKRPSDGPSSTEAS
jgi:methanethiol S-methyltransferase